MRATALALSVTVMRLLSVATLTLSAAAGRNAEPALARHFVGEARQRPQGAVHTSRCVQALLTIGGLLFVGGCFATLLLPRETAGALMAGDG